jgi:hypothetical protein
MYRPELFASVFRIWDVLFLLLKLDLHDAHADFRSLIRVAGIRCRLQCK